MKKASFLALFELFIRQNDVPGPDVHAQAVNVVGDGLDETNVLFIFHESLIVRRMQRAFAGAGLGVGFGFDPA